MEKRKVTVYSTKGKQMKEIETDATVWSQLKQEVENEGYDINNLHATENINRTDLAHKDAKLPEGEFTLFLRPKKTKSGLDVKGMGFKELRAIIKEDDNAKEHVAKVATKKGKSWTQLTTAELTTALTSYKASGKTVAKKEVVKATPKKVSKKTSKKVVEKAEEVEKKVITDLEKAKQALVLIEEIQDNTTNDCIEDYCEDAKGEIEALIEKIEEQGPSEEADSKENDEEAEKAAKKAALDAEFSDMEQDY